jgi:hypothetical protein
MPRLVKGGKYIYGLSVIGKEGLLKIPEEALIDYDLKLTEKVVILSGSKTSGGFSINSPLKIIDSQLKGLLKILEYDSSTVNFSTEENKIFQFKNKIILWTKLNNHGKIGLSKNTLDFLNLKVNDKLVVGKGGSLGPCFISKGRIYQEAINYSEMELF